MKYKIGDKVRIKSLDWYNENKDQHGRVACGYHLFTEEMSKFCGCTMIVCRRSNLGVMTMGGSASYWTDEMIEGIADVETQDKMVSLDRACEWLELHINDDKYYSCIGEETLIPYLIDDFKKAMEE